MVRLARLLQGVDSVVVAVKNVDETDSWPQQGRLVDCKTEWWMFHSGISGVFLLPASQKMTYTGKHGNDTVHHFDSNANQNPVSWFEGQLSQFSDTYVQTDAIARLLTSQSLTTAEKGRIQGQYASRHLREIVGSDARDVTFNITQNVLVMFYANWCRVCGQFLSEYEKVADAFGEREPNNVVIARMDAEANSMQQLGIEQIQYFPSFGFFPAGDESGESAQIFKVDKIQDPAHKWLFDFVNKYKANVDETGYLIMPDDENIGTDDGVDEDYTEDPAQDEF